MGQAFLLQPKASGVNISDANIIAKDVSYGAIAYGADGRVVGDSAFRAASETAYEFMKTGDSVMIGANGCAAKTLKRFEDGLAFAEDHWSTHYTKLDRIRCHGAQYINTEYSPKSDNVVYECRWVETALNSGSSIFGSTNTSSGSAKWTGVHYHPSAGSLYSATGATDGLCRSSGITAGAVNTVRTTIKNGTITMVINGVTYTGNYSGSIQNGIPIALFADKRNSDVVEYCNNLEMEYWRMYDNDVLVRDMISVQRKSDGAVGMLNLVTNIFHGNSGTGSFTGIR